MKISPSETAALHESRGASHFTTNPDYDAMHLASVDLVIVCGECGQPMRVGDIELLEETFQTRIFDDGYPTVGYDTRIHFPCVKCKKNLSLPEGRCDWDVEWDPEKESGLQFLLRRYENLRSESRRIESDLHRNGEEIAFLEKLETSM